MSQLLRMAGMALVSVLAAGCGGGGPAPGKTTAKTDAPKSGSHDHDHGHAHEHKAPHGGTLVALGDHFAHLEIVFDAATGKLTAYVLDGEAEKAVRIKQAVLELAVTLPIKDGATGEQVTIKLQPVANELTGEKSGDTSQFEGQDDKLKGLKEFDARVVALEVKGQALKDVAFNFPKGNEGDDHGHKH